MNFMFSWLEMQYDTDMIMATLQRNKGRQETLSLELGS